MSAETIAQQLYVSYFGRPADAIGLQNFAARVAQILPNARTLEDLLTAYKAGSPDVLALVNIFSSSVESNDLYSSPNTADFVEAIYRNVLGRGSEPAGLAFWVDAIDNRGLNEAQVALEIMAAALRNGAGDAVTVQKKTTIAQAFSDALNTPTEISAYSGNAAAAVARALLNQVEQATDVNMFLPNVDTTINQLVARVDGTASNATLIIDSTVGLSDLSKFSLDGARNSNIAVTADVTPTIEFQATASGYSYEVDWGNGTISTGTTTGLLQRVTLTQQYTGIQSQNIKITVFATNNQIDQANLELSVAQSTGSVYVDGLIVGTKIEGTALNGATPVYFYFDNTNSRQAFDTNTKDAFIRAMDGYAQVANLVFIEVSDPDIADFKFVLVGNEFFGDSSLLGQMFFPDSEKIDPAFAGLSGIGLFNIDATGWGDFTAGSSAFATIVHELGHGLGLAHPHDNGGVSAVFPETFPGFISGSPFFRDNVNLALNAEDNDNPINTVMTYDYSLQEGRPFQQFTGNSSGPGTLDIAALERLYGSKQANTGNNTYTITELTTQNDRAEIRAIHDTGGIDTLIYDGISGSFLSLLSADLLDTSPFVGGLESFSYTDSGAFGDVVAFSHRTIIENVVGGSGSDIIIGNEFNNNINGRGGDDIIIVSGGSDFIDGGTGFDVLSFFLSQTAVTVNFSNGQAFATDGTRVSFTNIEVIEGSFQSDNLTGSTGDNFFLSSRGNDIIQGGGGQDAFSAEFDVNGSVLSFSNQSVFYTSSDLSDPTRSTLVDIDTYYLTSFTDFIFLTANTEFELANSSGFVDAGESIDFIALSQVGQSLNMSTLNLSMYGVEGVFMNAQGASALQIRALDIATQVTEPGKWSTEIFGATSINKEFLVFGDFDDTIIIDSREWIYEERIAYDGDLFDVISSNVNGEIVLLGIDSDMTVQFSA